MFEFAVNDANENILQETRIKLTVETKEIEYRNEFSAAQKLCELLTVWSLYAECNYVIAFFVIQTSKLSFQNEMVAIFGPKSKAASTHVSNICDAKEIPFIDTYFDMQAKRSVVNLYPSHETLGTLLMDIVDAWEWKEFAILYESPSWLSRISGLLEVHNNNDNRIFIYRLVLGQPEFRAVLNKVKVSRVSRIVIQCSVDLLPEVMKQALQVGLLSESQHIIIADLDAQVG